MLMEDTIAAIATPLQASGLGVIRISGPDAMAVADTVFRSVSGKPLAAKKGYTAAFGHVGDRAGVFDEAVALCFRGPKSYTGEDVVELSIHGGTYLMKRLLSAVVEAGARPAAAGEFTKRAFLNGKVSLTQAEAVVDLIEAQGKEAAKAALAVKEGSLYKATRRLSETLLSLSGHLAAWVDFPEEDVPEVEEEVLIGELSAVKEQIRALLRTYDTSKIMKDGIQTVIVGRPNVGKSTLMNLLAGEEKSIVTSIPGTTRDVVEDTVWLGGVALRLADTAGIHETDDPVEKVGVQRAKNKLAQAQLVLAVFDSSQELSAYDHELLRSLEPERTIILVNKSDLGAVLTPADFEGFPYQLSISAAMGRGVEVLQERIAQVFSLQKFDATSALIANERQYQCCQTALSACEEALGALASGVTLDAVTVCVETALEALEELSGNRVSDSIVEEVFSQFCVGK